MRNITLLLIPVFLFCLLSPALPETMKKADVIYGGEKITPKMCLQQWDSAVSRIAAGYKVSSEDLAKAKKLVNDYKTMLDKETVSEAYCKIGFIKKDLYFRIKSKTSRFLPYKDDDILLALGAKPGEKKTEDLSGGTVITLPAYYALAKGDLPVNLVKMLDIGNGYSITINVEINGAKLSSAQEKRMKEIAAGIQENIGRSMRKKVRDLGEKVAGHTGGMSSLEKLINDTDEELKKMVDETAVNSAVEKAILEALAKENQESKLRTEWKVKCAAKTVLATIKMTTEGVKLYLTGGTDFSAYISIASNVKNIWNIIQDIRKKEPELRENLNRSIDDFIKVSENVYTAVEDIYSENKSHGKSTIKSIIDTAMRTKAAAKDKLLNTLKMKFADSVEKTADAENRRRRYKIFLAGARGNLDKELKELIKFEAMFKGSQVKAAVILWPELQKMKKHCNDVMAELKKNEDYCDDVEIRMKGLDIAVCDDTSLDKLIKAKDALREKKIKEAASGGAPVIAEAASAIKTGYDVVKELCSVLGAAI